jgi:PTH1 family peptidyl-tRNA hydrolase
MHIIVGLGNPGKKYENTKHNIGFVTLDFLAEKNNIKINKIKHKALVGEGIISGRKVLLVKPQTYMNLSGNSVREVMEYYKAEPEKLIVIYDDADIPMGRLRIRKKGSAGTHNGMKSIIYDLQEDGFPRVRIGIGKERKVPLAGYVLGGFAKEERELMEGAVERAALAVECILEKGIDTAMSEYNIRPSLQAHDALPRECKDE